MSRTSLAAALVAALVLAPLSATPALAKKDEHREKHEWRDEDGRKHKVEVREKDGEREVRERHGDHETRHRERFDQKEQVVLRDWLAQHGGKKQKHLPPGLAKKLERGGELPPGWQKKVARGQVLPEDLYRSGQPLPREVIIKLPPQPRGTRLMTVGDRIVRIIEDSRAVLDVLSL